MSHISLFVLSAILTGLAVFVWRARPDNLVNRWFAAFTLFAASWVFGIGGLHSGAHLDEWGRFTFASASLIPSTFLAFMRVYPTQSAWPSLKAQRAILATGLLIAILSISTPLMVYDNALTPAGLSRRTGPLYPLFSLYFLATWILVVALFMSKWRRARGIARAQLQYLGAGVIISAAGASIANLFLPILTGRSTYSWIGPYFSLLLVLMVGHAIIRHRLMDLRVVINRGLASAVATTLVSLIVILGVRVIAPNWETQTLLLHPDLVIFAIVILVMLSSPSQALLSRIVDPYLYRGRVDYATALRTATRRLSRFMHPSQLASELDAITRDAFVPESFTMYARQSESGSFQLLRSDLSAPIAVSEFFGTLSSPVTPSVVVINPSAEIGQRRILHEALRAAAIDVVLFLGRRNQVLGVVALGARRSGDAYFTRDLAFLESLSELASIALDNSLLYTQRIQMLEYSERLLESIDSAVVAVDVNGHITSFNRAARTLLGREELRRGATLDLLPSEIAWALALCITRAADTRETEAHIDHPTRGSVSVILSTAVLHDDRHQVTGALAVVTDLSTVKELERNKRRMEHFATMARFYAGIAHEIRSPLAAISNFVAMLSDRFDDPEYRDTVSRLLPLEVARIVRLADRIRLMAPSEDGKFAPIVLPRLLQDIVQLHKPEAQEQSVRIRLQCPENLPRIRGDQGQLVQLFVNLLRNALEALPRGGLITIDVRSTVDQNRYDNVIVSITDNGPGIDPAIRSKIFEPFFTTKAAGTGLGLSICKEIADFHNARLELLPRADRSGTVARIEFPCETSSDRVEAGLVSTAPSE